MYRYKKLKVDNARTRYLEIDEIKKLTETKPMINMFTILYWLL